jgi:DNA end-binding protein Ku
MLDLAEELIERKSAPFDPTAFESQYAAALRELIRDKRKSGHVTAAADEAVAGRGGEVIDLMQALKKSVERNKRRQPGRSSKKSKSGKKSSASAKKTAAR